MIWKKKLNYEGDGFKIFKNIQYDQKFDDFKVERFRSWYIYVCVMI